MAPAFLRGCASVRRIYILSGSLSERIFYVAQAMQMQKQSAAPLNQKNTSLICMDKGEVIRTMLSVPLPVDKKTPWD